MGYSQPTPIQQQAIPLVLEGKDVIGASQTGTGKTAAFCLPLLSKLERNGKVQILILEPTRELAEQVADVVAKFGKHMGLKVCLLYGGVGYGKQQSDLEAGADVVIATPGRLVDMFYRGTFRFGEIKALVLDEVDRMLDMGFMPIVRKIVCLCPWEGRQTLFFSATMGAQIQGFAKWCLNEPQEITIARQEVASTITHAFYPVAMEQRDDLLLALLRDTDYNSVMVFTRTKKEADTVHALLGANGHDKVAVMHGDVDQKSRSKAIQGFRDGEYEVLVATDVAARGIDISGVTHVINYRVPEDPQDYVHRIGRTGRAGNDGDAFTILTADELELAAKVESYTERKIKREKLANFDYVYSAILEDGPIKPVKKQRPPAPRRRR